MREGKPHGCDEKDRSKYNLKGKKKRDICLGKRKTT